MSKLRRILPIIIALIFVVSLAVPVAQSFSAPSIASAKKTKLKFEFLSLPWFPESDKAAEIVAKELQAVGIKMDLVRQESSIMYPRIMNTHNYDAFALAVSQDPDASGMLLAFHSSNAVPGGSNYWMYVNPQVDKLIDEALTETNHDKLRQIAWQIQEILSSGPFIPIYLADDIHVLRAEWKNYTIMPGGVIEAYNIWSMIYMYKEGAKGQMVFRIAFPSDVLSTNPLMATDFRSLWILNLIYDPLVRISPSLKVVPWLAKSWDVSSDGKTYIFHLVENAKWHDGQPFTADDVVFSFNYAAKNKAPRYADVLKLIDKVEKVDDHTVKFVLKKPSPFFLIKLAVGSVYIVPKHIWEGKPIDWSNPKPIGTGPFKFQERVQGEKIVLVRNDDWWYHSKPNINTIVMVVIPNAETRFLAIKRGEVDTERYSTSATLIPEIKKDPNLKLITAPGIWLIYIAFNYQRISDPAVFRAINYAINRTEIVQKVVGGYGIPVYTVLNKVWHGDLANPNIKFEYNPEKAKQILEAAGWKDIDGDGIREYVGTASTTTTTTTTTTTSSTSTPISVGTSTVTVTRTVGVTSTVVSTTTKTVERGASTAGLWAATIIIIIIILAAAYYYTKKK